MAVDTQAKRQSLIRVLLPAPDGSISADDRRDLLMLYSDDFAGGGGGGGSSDGYKWPASLAGLGRMMNR